jgi:hypothetical protein
VLCNAKVPGLNRSQPSSLLRIAQDVKWLLAQRDLVINLDSLHCCYKNILAELGFTHNGSVQLGKLYDAFQSFYPPQLLSLLQCRINMQKSSNWLSRFLPYLNRGISSHPLRHLLFIQFLGHTAELFFNRCKLDEPFKPVPTKSPFGEGSWFCLNPICDYFRKRSIKDCRVTYSHQGKTYYGTFRCACGFTYIHRLPYNSDEDELRAGKVKDYGSVWELALKEFWNNPYFTLKDIALELGVYHKTIKYQALRLGLNFPRPGPGFPLTQVSPKHQKRVKRDKSSRSNELKVFRRKWLSNLKKNNGASRSVLRRHLIHIYYWLSKHDRVWLEAHLPPPRWNNRGSGLLDWGNRDAQIADEVRRTTSQLMNTEGRPIRITKSAIFRDRKQYKWLISRKNASKLPLTLKALSEVVETRVQFSLRRIRWAVDCFSRENIVPSFSRLAQRAGVANSVSLPEVDAALESSLRILQGLDTTDIVKAA